MQKVERTERPPTLDDKRFGWQVSEGIANLRLECLRLAIVFSPKVSAVNTAFDPIALAKRMSDFVIDGTVATKDTTP